MEHHEQDKLRGKPRNYVKPVGTLLTYKGKKFIIESRPGKRRKNEPPIAKIEVLRMVIAEAEGTVFNEEQRSLFFYKDTTTGRGEKAIRHQKGISLVTPGSTKSIDILELGIEVKEWGRLRPGDSAGSMWSYFKMGLYNEHVVEFETPIVFNDKQTTYRRLISVSVTKTMLDALPYQISDKIRHELRPSNILQGYPILAFVWNEGYVEIPLSEYDEALALEGVSQQLPRYEIRRKYLEKRAIAALPAYIAKMRTKMKKIAVVAGAFKPFHKGHLALVEIAARENDEVRLFVSLTDRPRPGEVVIKGETMERLWREHYSKALPTNVIVEYLPKSKSPIGAAYEFLGKENEAGSDDLYRLYGTHGDLASTFPVGSLEKYFDRLWPRRQIELQPISRGETVAVSGTEMRNWLATGDEQSFIENSPHETGKHAWDAIIADGIEITPLTQPKTKKRKK